MLARLPIRFKLILALVLWLITVSVLCWSSFEGLYAFRGLVKHLGRVANLPRATSLERRVSQLHLEIAEWELSERRSPGASLGQPSSEGLLMRMQMQHAIEGVRESLREYREESESKLAAQPGRDFNAEHAHLKEIERTISELSRSLDKPDWNNERNPLAIAEQLKAQVGDLPRAVQSDVSQLPQVAGVAYEQRIHAAWLTSLSAAGLMAFMLWILYRWVFRPLRVLIKGSRKVAAGDFDVAIRLDSRDEMGELAAAMNEMTHEFQTIRDDLDRQVQERTGQAVRTERLAGVGFLAAGVADEISAPLAVIRDRAKTLEAIFASPAANPHSAEASAAKNSQSAGTVLSELQAITAAAFRCKEITQSLLDLSRSGTDRRERFDICELGQSVIDLLTRSGKYANKQVELNSERPIIIEGNPQEIKQVVLSLLVHRLDRVAAGERVTLHASLLGDVAELAVSDNAKAAVAINGDVTSEFEDPSTIFGLSLAKCIVQEHGGHIDVPTWTTSESGRREHVRVTLPLAEPLEESSHQYQVA